MSERTTDRLADEYGQTRLQRLIGPGGAVRRGGLGALGAILIAAALYYPTGMILTHKVDDDPDFRVEADVGESAAVATAIGLIRREVDTHGWVANNPWFFASAPLDNMPNFQQGIIGALSRFAVEMGDHIGRVRGSSQADADLEKAAGLLKYRGDVWIFDLSTSLMPTATSEAQYRSAAQALEAYNVRLARGEAVFERRADNLHATLERVAADLGSLSARLDAANDDLSAISFTADDVFYHVKGRLYGYWKLLEALGRDYDNVIAERELGAVWQQMLDSMREGALLDPLVVFNGAPDSVAIPSHLTAQGFYLLRARTRLREITDVLLK